MAKHARISEFVEDLRRITAETSDDKAIIAQVRPLVKTLCDDPEWVMDDYYKVDPETGIGINVLHEEPDHRLAMFAICWRPGRVGLPHDHGTWAVVGGIDGEERNINWRRIDDGSEPGRCEVEKASEVVAGPGDVVSFLPGDIHSVNSEGDRVTLSLHVYGMHTNFTDRYSYNPETGAMARHILKLAEPVGG